ncbi:A/G-specific adenine glycosylase [Parapedobacter sp. ISTM3]|uniref:Adenine DNA glycosylase n=1 Tax=Parapedobacter luteus TaxID=623280 RepID=A0A1T5EPR8_9SPHI|nr:MULTISPECIES: A/G-specific adenine glycosylase [Parapedobacter]MBK1441250.1 A/G-specific adenine glycosylase [Parapedobacter sp. ISTM3]SKB85660.1 A/G-specific DNA-adenine glycosylase [Parapedobacter luteus]
MAFSSEIIGWYQQYKRDLPWRHTRDPYVIWLSEVILQQTRVEQGLPYFLRFLSHYPDVIAFANAPEDEILLHWQGLGYYSRARNMHKAAQAVVSAYGGVFPTRYDDLIRLQGIGEYTAAAIASFAANEARAVVDGNVFRVLARYFGIDEPINSSKGKKLFLKLADDLLDRTHPGLYNQAVMEFGAMQCKPKNPDCANCVLRLDCRAFSEERISQLPVKLKGKASRNRYFNYFVVAAEGRLLMNKRGKGDIWENLYELPMIETPCLMGIHELAGLQEVVECFGEQADLRLVAGPVKHVLSHQNLFAQFIAVDANEGYVSKKMKWNYVFTKDLGTLAKPKLIYSFLKDYMVE